MFDFLVGNKAINSELDACQQTNNTATDAVYMANHYIFTEREHPGYTLKSIELIENDKYQITISDGHSFTVSEKFADDITIAIADEFNRYYRETICNLKENMDED